MLCEMGLLGSLCCRLVRRRSRLGKKRSHRERSRMLLADQMAGPAMGLRSSEADWGEVDDNQVLDRSVMFGHGERLAEK